MTIILEERGARDALAQAFEEQKKYEQIAEQQRLLGLKEEARQETAALDELGLRRAAR
jgi:flagellar FliJ protein